MKKDTIYLTNREAALHLCNGGNLEIKDAGKWVPATGDLIDFSMLDQFSPPYRAAVETFQITVRGVAFDVPEPVREPLERRQVYWSPDPVTLWMFHKDCWDGLPVDIDRLSRGLIHLTEAAAVTHAKAMCGVM